MKLNSETVREIFLNCLFKENENRDNAIMVTGITFSVGFNPIRLNKHKEDIVQLLDNLKDEFKQDLGGGYSFLEACFDKYGNHWGEHRNVEELFLLGIAIDKVEYLLPRELWMTLPGGVPYLVIKQ